WRRPAALVPTCSCGRVKPRSAVSTGPNTVFTVGITHPPHITTLSSAPNRVLHPGARACACALASRFRNEDGDAPCGPRLVLRIWRECRYGEIPEPRPLRLVLDLADPHRLHRGVVADLDGRVGAQVVHPDRVLRCPAHGPDEDVVGAVLDAHQRGLAD